jgi:hypothetical protein
VKPIAPSTDRVTNRKEADAAGDALCEAVAVWWRAMGGIPLVAGGIILRDAGRKGVFELCIRVTGIRPDLTYELPPKKTAKRKRK